MELDRDAVLDGLEDAGLTAYQAEAYLTLLEQGTSKAVDVARRSSIPVPRIYDVVKELEQMGYVETLDRETLHVRAVEPVSVIEDLYDRSRRMSDVATAIENRWEQTPVAEHEVNVTKRAGTAIDHARAQIREAEHSVELAVSARELLEFEEALEATPDDVVVRVSLYGTAADDEVIDAEFVRNATTEVRDREYSSPLLVLVDGETSCYAPMTSLPDPYGVIVKGDHITIIFRWYFQTCLWAVWEPCYRREGTDGVFVSLEEFVCEVYEDWYRGDTVRAKVDGVNPETGDRVSVTGCLTDVRYTGQIDSPEPPTLTDLAGGASIVVSDGEYDYTVGGWGAHVEDIEARRIELEESVDDA